MNLVDKNALVPYSVEQMFNLVNDIASYPSFLPWCKKIEIHQQTESEIIASLTLAVHSLEKTFTTKNPIQKNQSIEMHLVEGPFSHLYGRWEFQPLGEMGCKITLKMEFDFSSIILKKTLGPIFSKIVNTLVDAFIQRAGELYGKS
ncbi:MAG: hypothetical protein RIT27_1155 [Pseudomonadota bacterium]|jgi:ribosome-associated toxin RatA of RatAB toxin-antitoxin module